MLLSVNKHRGPETLKSLIDSLVGWFIHLFIHNKISWVVSGWEGIPFPLPVHENPASFTFPKSRFWLIKKAHKH